MGVLAELVRTLCGLLGCGCLDDALFGSRPSLSTVAPPRSEMREQLLPSQHDSELQQSSGSEGGAGPSSTGRWGQLGGVGLAAGSSATRPLCP